MFAIEASPTVGVHGDKLRVVDHERVVWLQRIAPYAMTPVLSFQLHVDERVFLVERLREQKPDGHYGSLIVNLGVSPIGTMSTGIKSDGFRSDADRRRIGLLAAEALLVYGSNYNGSSDPTVNDQTIDFDGHTYRLSDFVHGSSGKGDLAKP